MNEAGGTPLIFELVTHILVAIANQCMAPEEGKRIFDGDISLPSGMEKAVKDFWVAELGASTHMESTFDGISGTQETDDEVAVGDGKTLKATLIGKRWMSVV